MATRFHNFEMIMFPDPFERNGSKLEDGKLALIHGIVSRRNGEMSLAAHEIFDLETSIPRIVERINFILEPNDSSVEFLELLRKTIDHEYNLAKTGNFENAHTSEVAVSFLVENQIVETNSSTALKIAINGSNYKTLRKHRAVAGIRIHSIPVQAVDDRKPWEKRGRKY
jgi:DNA polymerase III alpha subunit